MKGGYGIYLALLFLLVPCHGRKEASNNDIMVLIKHILNDISQLTDHVQKQEARLAKQIEELEVRTTEKIQLLETKTTEQIQLLETKTTDKIRELGTQVTEGISLHELKITEQLKLLEIKASEQIQKLHVNVTGQMKQEVQGITKQIGQTEVIMTERMKELEAKTSTQILELGTQVTGQISQHKRELTEQMELYELRVTEQIKTLDVNMTGRMEREELKLMAKIQRQDAQIDVVKNYVHGSEYELSQGLKNLTLKINGVNGILTGVRPGKSNETAAPSCQWLDEHYFNLKDGVYWTSGEKGPKREYCEMNITDVRNSKKNPGVSCKALKEKHKYLKSGMYWVMLDWPTEVFCDMETEEGGWTMIGQAFVEEESQSKEVEYQKLLSDDLKKLREVTNKRFLLSQKGLNMLQKYISFTEMRFYCHKPWHGRTVHIRTNNNGIGKSVVNYLLGKSSKHPPSCGSYTRFSDDNSNLGRFCDKWYSHWWHTVNMYYQPMVIDNQNYFSLVPGRIECDDLTGYDGENFRTVGKWAYYVR